MNQARDDDFRKRYEHNLYYVRGQAIQSASANDRYNALALTVRDYLVDRWHQTVDTYYEANPKFVYYLSAEYLLGRQLTQNLLYSNTGELAREAVNNNGDSFEELLEQDVEPGLGNGGLG
ncbi:MAG TPA: glycogen phosphorylase, partial [Anaerolineae bacterium]|nr:glycogen phosphorylase [Anaerolineae bacterium]